MRACDELSIARSFARSSSHSSIVEEVSFAHTVLSVEYTAAAAWCRRRRRRDAVLLLN